MCYFGARVKVAKVLRVACFACVMCYYALKKGRLGSRTVIFRVEKKLNFLVKLSTYTRPELTDKLSLGKARVLNPTLKLSNFSLSHK